MATIIEMPKLSDTMTSGTVVNWLKKEGDPVESGDTIAEVETDKAIMPLESFDSGVLLKIVAQTGSQVACKAPLAVIGEKGEKFDESILKKAPGTATLDKAESEAKPASNAPAAPAPAAAPAPSAPTIAERVKASPLAKKVAKEMGVNLSTLTGTGPGGRIVKKDVTSAPTSSGGAGWGIYPAGPIAKEGRQSLSNMRQTIARRLLESKTQIPHFYLSIEIDAAPLVELRASLNDSFAKLPKPFKLSLNDFVLKATASTLRAVPAVNASYEGDAIRQFGSVHLSFAVAIAEGLITPVIRDAQDKNLKMLSEEAKVLAVKARDGKLRPEEFTGGTFTISNLGAWGIDQFCAIINPPQAAILAVGNVVKKPVVNADDQIVVGQRMSLTLSCDHRVVDGAIAAKFLQEIRTLLENPALLLI